jgi:hypothetical protein
MDNAAKDFAHKIIAQLEKIHEALLTGPPRQQNKASVGPKTATENKGDSAPRRALVVSPPPKDTNEPKNTRNGPAPRRKIGKRVWRWTKRIFLKKDRLEKVGITAGIVYAIVTVFQWRDLRRNFTIDQRAWLQVRDKEPTYRPKLEDFRNAVGPGYRFEIPRDAINIGRTPAVKVYVHTAAEVVDREKAPTFNYGNGLDTDTGILFPNTPRDFIAGSSAVIGDGRIQKLAGGDAYVAIYGIAAFVDIFGHEHWTRFCGWYWFKEGRPFSARACTDYNSADPN